MKKALVIVENEATITCNLFRDEKIIDGRIKKCDYDVVFELIFSNSYLNTNKILNFRTVSIAKDNRYDQRFYCSEDYLMLNGPYDFRTEFVDIVKRLEITHWDCVCSGNEARIDFLKEIIPYDLTVIPLENLLQNKRSNGIIENSKLKE